MPSAAYSVAFLNEATGSGMNVRRGAGGEGAEGAGRSKSVHRCCLIKIAAPLNLIQQLHAANYCLPAPSAPAKRHSGWGCGPEIAAGNRINWLRFCTELALASAPCSAVVRSAVPLANDPLPPAMGLDWRFPWAAQLCDARIKQVSAVVDPAPARCTSLCSLLANGHV